MKILHIIPSLDPESGGVSQAVRSIINYVNVNVDHEVVSLDEPDADFIRSCDFKVHALGRGKTAWNYHPVLKSWLTAHLEDYDWVIVHGLWQYQSRAVYQVFKKLKPKTVKLAVMPHGMLDPYFQRAKGRRIKALRNLVFWLMVEQFLINNAAALLFTCETERLLAHEPFGPYRPKRELVVGLGVDQPPTYNLEMTNALNGLCPEIGDAPYLLFLSRIHPKKGLDLLIDAYLLAKEKHASVPKLLIAGPGLETAYGQKVLAHTAGNPDIIFGGMLTGPAKWGAFYGCDAFVLPSHQENFGIAVVEALACGKPVLISDQVNIFREIQGDNAGIVKRDTPEGVVSLLDTWLIKSTEQKEALTRNALMVYEKYYAPVNAGKAMMEVFKIK